MALAKPSALVILEAPRSFLLEGRPDVPGGLVHPGRWGLFGGGIEEDEGPEAAAYRELEEELSYRPDELRHIGEGVYTNSSNRAGQRVPRHITVYHTEVSDPACLTMNVPGTIVELPKSAEALAANQQRLTAFAHHVLALYIEGQPVNWS